MPARILKTDTQVSLQTAIHDAAKAIFSGGIVAVPTESFYGLAVHALNQKAIERLFAVKQRREDNPVLILIPSKESLSRYVTEVSEKVLILMERFWPGGLTMVFSANPVLPRSLTAGTGKIGVRLSSHPVPTGLARAVGAPITGTSANVTGEPPCTDAEQVLKALGSQVDIIIDSGKTAGRKGSTVLDVTVASPAILREGMVTRQALTPFL